MPLLNVKEFNKEKESPDKNISVIPDTITLEEVKQDSNILERARRYIHADYGPGGSGPNFDSYIILDDEKIKYCCVDGLIDTKNKKLANFLDDKHKFSRELSDEEYEEED
jgi:hypothetical protein